MKESPYNTINGGVEYTLSGESVSNPSVLPATVPVCNISYLLF